VLISTFAGVIGFKLVTNLYFNKTTKLQRLQRYCSICPLA